MNIKYFVSYFFQLNGMTGFGNDVIEHDRKIQTEGDIRIIENKISAKNENDHSIILNYKEMEEIS